MLNIDTITDNVETIKTYRETLAGHLEPRAIEARIAELQAENARLVAEAATAAREAFARGRGTWTGRTWDDPGRVTPELTDEQIAEMAVRRGLVTVTSWGIPDDGSDRSQRWRRLESAASVRLTGALVDLGEVAAQDDEVVRRVCSELRALAAESDSAVALDASSAEGFAALAIERLEAGDTREATDAAAAALAIERAYGDTPAWGPLAEAIAGWCASYNAAAA